MGPIWWEESVAAPADLAWAAMRRDGTLPAIGRERVRLAH